MPFDARRFDTAWDRYVAAIGRTYPAFPTHLSAPARPAALSAAEKALNASLPDDLKHLLSRHGGCDGQFVLPGWELFSPDRIASEWGVWEELRRTQFVPEGYACEPEGPILGDEWWRLGWIPFCGDGGGNHLCLDVDPAPGGTVGQVISMWHDAAERQLIAASLTDFIELIATDAEAGEIEWNEDWGGVHLPEDA